MRPSELDFRTKLDAARVWERRLAGWIRSRGWYVVPTYDFNGKGEDKAPKLLAPAGLDSLVLPDLQCFRDGEHKWLECKWKACATLYRRGGYLTTGISQRLCRHYQTVEQITGAGVVLVFLHEREREIRGAPLSDMRSLESHKHPGGGGMPPMIFWRYERIPLWGALGMIESLEAAE